MNTIQKLAGLALVIANVSAPFRADAQTLDAAGEGRRLYLKLNCAGCHGNAGGGGMGPPVAREAEEVRAAVLNGEGKGMRSYAGYVNDTDIANLAAYLRSIGTPSEPKFTHWWEPVPSK